MAHPLSYQIVQGTVTLRLLLGCTDEHPASTTEHHPAEPELLLSFTFYLLCNLRQTTCSSAVMCAPALFLELNGLDD
jgi:hypothetical protein